MVLLHAGLLTVGADEQATFHGARVAGLDVAS
jgi:hypothetical protein